MQKGPRKFGRGEVVKVGDLFAKYKKILKAPEGSVCKEFVEVVSDVLGITVAVEKVTYKPTTRIITLKVGGPLKSELLLHKKELLTHLTGRLGPESAPKDFI